MLGEKNIKNGLKFVNEIKKKIIFLIITKTSIS